MKCWNCEHFKILYGPIKAGKGEYWDLGMAKCEKHDLVVDFINERKLKRMECVEEVNPALVGRLHEDYEGS